FRLVLLADRLLEFLLFDLAPGAARRFDPLAFDDGEYARGLFPAHNRDAGIRPREQETGAIRATAHAVVAGAVRAAHDHGDLRYLRTSDRGHHLGAVLGDAARLVFTPHHESHDVLQKQQRDAALTAELDEVGRLQGRFRKQDAVVGKDAD